MQQPEAAGAKVQQRFDNLNYNDIKKGKQLKFLRVSHGIVVANLIEKNMMDYYLGEHMVIWFSMIFYKES